MRKEIKNNLIKMNLFEYLFSPHAISFCTVLPEMLLLQEDMWHEFLT
jgi:hypothetical protein